jgi:hypothetical protein
VIGLWLNAEADEGLPPFWLIAGATALRNREANSTRGSSLHLLELDRKHDEASSEHDGCPYQPAGR